ncbi:DUF2254 domain-containing protein [Arthrobacter sp. zg-Y40]|uniref:DUF2254 domain-containing protein n=1 Tax=Arthrobacter sp. zg-Y40 TaxID=2886939 RepID=UPI001D152561|nr:DUF2254 domain-containing protein [Arthrobacter sp. zg-Y40]MCC3278497.1 DUF2254 domain-containing protein [Arthrobacter sp. zg-Y40]
MAQPAHGSTTAAPGPRVPEPRFRITRDGLRASMWFWPSCASLAALLVTLLLMPVRPGDDVAWARWIWPTGVDAASSLLQTVATSVMTAATVTFSLTVVALQLASQQFSPRLLREFARDVRTQAVLGVLLGTFLVSITGLHGMDADRPVPVLVVGLVYVLGIASGIVLLLFIGHIARSLRVDTMMRSAHQSCLAVLRDTYPLSETGEVQEFPVPDGGTLVPVGRSGIVQTVDWKPLMAALEKHGLKMRIMVQPGDHVTLGSPVARVWADDGGTVPLAAVRNALAESLEIGYERTPEQDAALGLRQLTDIAVKAISPSINDPITAAHATGYCADLLVDLQRRRLGPEAHQDAHGVQRLVTDGRDYRYFLDLVCGPVRRFAHSEPIVLTAVLRLLRDCAATAVNESQRAELRRQNSLVLETARNQMVAADDEEIRDMGRRVEEALAGNLTAAFTDRAGETRSV